MKKRKTRRFSDSVQLPLAWMSSRRRGPVTLGVDGYVLATTYALALVGLVMVFSASGVMAETRYGDPMYFLKRQAVWLMVGLAVLHLISLVDYHVWKHLTPYFVGVTVILLALVLVPFLGTEVKGARRWFRMGSFSLQPAEMAKMAVVLYMAVYLTRREDQLTQLGSGFLRPVIVVGVLAGLVLVQPDMGTAVVLGLLLIGLLFLGGARVSHLSGMLLLLVPLFAALVVNSEYRLRRLLSFWDPWQDPTDSGFQLIQSFVALGSGGIFGVGLGESKQKLFFLPEAHADFVLALVGEELGILGTCALMALFALLIFRGFYIAGRAKDAFGCHLALGVTLLLGIQALINAGVVSGLLPTKGLTLPLVSYGGSSLMINLFAIGLLLNVSREKQVAKTRFELG